MEETLPLGYKLAKEISQENSRIFTAYLGEERRIVKIYSSPKSPNGFWGAMDSPYPGTYLQGHLDWDTAHWAAQKQGHPNVVPLLDTAVVPRASGLGWTIYEFMPQYVELEEHMDFCPFHGDDFWHLARDLTAGLQFLHKNERNHGNLRPEHVLFDGEHYRIGDLSGGDGNDVVDWGLTMYWALNGQCYPGRKAGEDYIPMENLPQPRDGDVDLKNLVLWACKGHDQSIEALAQKVG